MKLPVILFSLLLFFSCTTSTQETEATTEGPAILDQIQAPVRKNFTRKYSGKINEKQITMEIVNTNGNLTGYYIFFPDGKQVLLDGKLNGEAVELYERNGNRKITGVIKGKLSGNNFSGEWEVLSSGEKFTFDLRQGN